MKTHKSFEKFVKNSRYIDEMIKFVKETRDICPAPDKVFRFLENDLSKVKCIILGMDPYPSTYIDKGIEYPVATGRAFEVANIDLWTDKYKQVSLSNIFKALCYLKYNKIYNIDELRNIVSRDNFRYINIHDWFDAMENEGVMFLNATLTTLKNKSGVHTSIWMSFMDELIKNIINNISDVKWLIWGNDAYKRVKDIVDKRQIIYTCHPATRVNNTFVKDCCFKKVTSINWI